MKTTDPKDLRNELVNHIKEQNEKINAELNCKVLDRYNYVVVSKDLNYQVSVDDRGYLSVSMLTTMDDAVRLSESEAERITKTFHAKNGYGKIEWKVMNTRDFLLTLLESNNDMLEFLNNRN